MNKQQNKQVIIARNKDGELTEIARVRYVDGAVQISGEDDAFVASLKAGVVDRLEERQVMPEEGLRFLRAVSQKFDSAYLSATEIQDAA